MEDLCGLLEKVGFLFKIYMEEGKKAKKLIAQKQFLILLLLQKRDLAIHEIKKELRLGQSELSQLLSFLEKRKLIFRQHILRSSTQSQRTRLVKLTAVGNMLTCAQVKLRQEKIMKLLHALGLSEDDQTTLQVILKRVQVALT